MNFNKAWWEAHKLVKALLAVSITASRVCLVLGDVLDIVSFLDIWQGLANVGRHSSHRVDVEMEEPNIMAFRISLKTPFEE
jgi:hypothetical protein